MLFFQQHWLIDGVNKGICDCLVSTCHPFGGPCLDGMVGSKGIYTHKKLQIAKKGAKSGLKSKASLRQFLSLCGDAHLSLTWSAAAQVKRLYPPSSVLLMAGSEQSP